MPEKPTTHLDRMREVFDRMHSQTIGFTDAEVFDAVALMIASIEGQSGIPSTSFDYSLRIMRSRIPEAIAMRDKARTRN